MAWTVTTLREADANKLADSRTQSRFYYALADNDSETEVTAVSATGVPTIGTAHPSDAVSFVSSIRATRDPEKQRLFKIEVQYSTKAQEEQNDDPLSEPVSEEWTAYTDTELATGYYDSGLGRYVAFTTSAGEPFEPIEVPVHRTSLVATRNEPSFNANTANIYAGSVNTDNFQGAAPGEALCVSITGSRVSRPNNFFYWVVRYEFQFRPVIPKVYTRYNFFITDVSPWDLLIVDQGFYEAVDDGNGNRRMTKIKDGDGSNVSVAVPLDGIGNENITFDPTNPPPQVFRYYPYRPRRLFSAFGL